LNDRSKISRNIDRSSFYRRFHVTSGRLDFWLPLRSFFLPILFLSLWLHSVPLLTLWRTFFFLLSSLYFGLLCVEVIFLCFHLIIILFCLHPDWMIFSLSSMSLFVLRELEYSHWWLFIGSFLFLEVYFPFIIIFTTVINSRF